MIRQHHISVRRTARFLTFGPEKAQHWYYVLHGYGQLATRFIQKFKPLGHKDRFFIAPEGPHRFYLEGHGGHVGASWMTKEDRTVDIGDYVEYLNTLHTELTVDGAPDRITVIAFSQGVATAFRWIGDGRIPVDHFLICSGVLPPDLDLDLSADAFTRTRLDYLTGDRDPYKDDSQVHAALERLRDHGISCQTTIFHGGHRIDLQTISEVLEEADDLNVNSK